MKRLGDVTVQTLIGGVAFAALATAIPILRFSGHHELEAMLHWGQDAGMAAMLIAVLILGTPAIGPLCIGIACGWAASKLAPESTFH